MKSLSKFIKENLDDNLIWKLNQWFQNKPEEEQEFTNIVFQCQSEKSIDNVETFLNSTSQFINTYMQLVNFIYDDLSNNPDKDYIYLLQLIIKNLMGNYSKDNKFAGISRF